MIHNFSAGPGILPRQVLLKVQQELIQFQDAGISVMEMSHRSSHFKSILANAESDLRQLLDIPTNYKVLFMQGGASTQFSAILLNLVSTETVDYIVTGQWSQKAYKEAIRMGFTARKYDHQNIPTNSEIMYYCDNETVDGFELPNDFVDVLPKDAVVVCDMSSNFASRKINVSKFGVIFGGAQKNMGPAGVTIVIVRDDLLDRFEKCPVKGPLMLSYKVCADNGSMYNTPPTFSIYVCGLVFRHWLDYGGLEKVERESREKSGLLYSKIDQSSSFECPVPLEYRSRMNVVFRILKDGKPDTELEKLFVKEAEAQQMICLAGHRSVGGIRASLYNALPISSVQKLVDFMKEFESRK